MTDRIENYLKKSPSRLLALAIAFALLTVVVWATQCAVIYIPHPMAIESGMGGWPNYDLLDRNFTPKWSADSSQIVFFADGGYFVASADGSNVREIERGLSPDISPDGSRLVYAIDGDYYDSLDDKGIMWEPRDFEYYWVIATSMIDGNALRALTSSMVAGRKDHSFPSL